MNTESVDHLATVLQQIIGLLWATLGLLLVVIVIFSICFIWVIRAAKLNVISLESRAFQVEASALLQKGEYLKLKEIAAAREKVSPGDSLGLYYLGMAHYRCQEYVDAKRCFASITKLDANWKKVADRHLAEIEEALKKLKPRLVESEHVKAD